jgi:hypothetical protein
MFELKDLIKAYRDCRKRKRGTESALGFEYSLERNLYELYEELKEGEYEIGTNICFVVTEPKVREIWAADFRDRIVHHLVYNFISERYYNRFIKDTYSCIPKRGTLKAALALQRHAKAMRDGYYLKADLRNFFVSINKEILMEELRRYVDEQWLLKLLEQIVFHDPRFDVELRSGKKLFERLPRYKSLWYTDNEQGLPIGNLTSQFFSNVYLNILDQYVKQHLKCKYYTRYVDDFVIMHESAQQLNIWHKQIEVFLKERLKLELHPDKKSIGKVESGVDFVGFVIRPGRLLLRQKILKKAFKVIREYKKSSTWFEKQEMVDFRNTINSYLGMLRAVNGYKLRKKICWECINLFISCDEEFTKLMIN